MNMTGKSTNKMIRMLALISLFLFMLNCSSKRKVSTIDAFPFEIRFGSTGGFTNINPVFMVKSTGEVLKKDNASSEPYLLKKITRPIVDSLYLLIRDSKFESLKINQVSNITKYIEIKSEKFTNKVTWSDDSQIPVELMILNQTLIKTIKN
jgi:hypothetical protein